MTVFRSGWFNYDYYMSNDFFGLLSQGSFYANMYLRQLSDISAGYHAVGELAQLEGGFLMMYRQAK